MTQSNDMLAMTPTSRALRRNLQLGLLVLLLLCSLAFVLRLMLAPDPARNFYYKAQSLEAKGMLQDALNHYDLVSLQTDSPYAPRALQQRGDILAGLARRSGDQEQMREAIAAYTQLADNYQDNPLAGEALFSAGQIATNDLRDMTIARRAYETVRERYPNNRGYVSKASVLLGRVELMEGHAKPAQALLQSVLQTYANFPEHCAEAQYHLGVVYETLFKKPQWAQNAYRLTIERYKQTVWAQNAQERLGMLFYSDYRLRRDERRVQIEVPPLADEGGGSSLYSAVGPLLAAYGVQVGSTSLRAWSLEPFYAGFVPENPSRTVRADVDDFHNILGMAGLRIANKRSKDAKLALQNLQDEIDAGRPTLIYNGQWRLVTGYDSTRDQLFMQNRGAAFDVVAVRDFSPVWQRNASESGFRLVSVQAPGAPPKPKITPGQSSSGPTSAPTTPGAQINPSVPSLLPAPSWRFELPSLSTKAAHRRAVRRAAAMMSRSREGNALLNLEALDELAKELGRLATAPADAPAANELLDEPARRDDDVAAGATTRPTPTTAPQKAQANAVARTRSILGWFGTPLQSWTNSRRDAAAYMDTAANALGQSALSRAAELFRTAIDELEQAAASMPSSSRLSDDDKLLTDSARADLSAASRHIAAARDAERRAVAAMDEIG